MIYYKSEEEIDFIRKSSLLVGKTHAEMVSFVKPGVTTMKLDKIAEECIKDNGGIPAFKGYNGFPYTICSSLNEEVVHGMPNEQPLRNGDILSIDCGVLMNGYYGDSAYTYEVGDVSKEIRDLLLRTKECLYKGIQMAVAGNRIGDIGEAIQTYAESFGYGVVREMVGHGLGKSLHESPEVPNHGKRGQGIALKEGLVIAIEPMINLGSPKIDFLDDGWTVRTADQMCSAHFEHTIVVRQKEAEVLSSFEGIENKLVRI